MACLGLRDLLSVELIHMAGKLVLASAGGSLRALAPSHVVSLQGAEQGRCAWHF